MSRVSLAVEKGRALFTDVICSAANFPVAFTYGGKRYAGLDGLACEYRNISDDALDAAWRVDDKLRIMVSAKYCAEFGQSEYTVYFENTGDGASEVLTDVAALYHGFEGSESISRGIQIGRASCRERV